MESNPQTTTSPVARLKAAYRTRRLVRWAVDGGVLLVLVAAIGAWQTRKHLSDVPPPAFTLQALGGGEVSSASLLGKPGMLVLWAPWCGVCKAQFDNVGRVRRWLGERANVVSIALAYRDVASVEAYAKAGVDYPVLLGTSELEEAFRVDAFPTVYFLDAQGRIKHSASGYTTTLGMLWRLWW